LDVGGHMKKEHVFLLLVNFIPIAAFGSLFVARANYEFIIYAGVIILSSLPHVKEAHT
jgi:hypothetical protein